MPINKTPLQPATNLDEVYDLFAPISEKYASGEFYVNRNEKELIKLERMLKRGHRFHGFLCGHVGCGKTTELNRLVKNKDITNKFYPVLFSIKDIQVDSNKVTHDALLVAIGNAIIKACPPKILDKEYADKLNNWGAELIKSSIKNDEINNQIKGNINLWLLHFRSWLRHREQNSEQIKLTLEPKVNELIDLLNDMAVEIELNSQKKLLVMVDDLEKGNNSDREMHHRIFNQHYDVITKPNFNILYTLPVYFRGLSDKRIRPDDIFSFPAVRLYEPNQKQQIKPKLDKNSEGYKLIHEFIEKRIAKLDDIFAPDTLDDLILIGGGLFRETDSAIAQAADIALYRGSEVIEPQDVDEVFTDIKKEYQPSIRDKELELLAAVLDKKFGWVNDIEPLLQSGAVVEYENGDIWLDIRYVLKAFVKQSLPKKEQIITS